MQDGFDETIHAITLFDHNLLTQRQHNLVRFESTSSDEFSNFLFFSYEQIRNGFQCPVCPQRHTYDLSNIFISTCGHYMYRGCAERWVKSQVDSQREEVSCQTNSSHLRLRFLCAQIQCSQCDHRLSQQEIRLISNNLADAHNSNQFNRLVDTNPNCMF